MKLKFFILLLILCTMLSIAQAQDASPVPTIPDFDVLFVDVEGTFLLHDVNRDMTITYNRDRAAERFAPFSTFKIFNAAIALETGVASDANFTIAYDESRYPYTEDMAGFWSRGMWQADHTLQSAMRNSIVWYYTELAMLIGQDEMAAQLERIGYGNADVSGWMGETATSGGNRFWLGGSLRISADEQLDMLRRLYAGELFSAATTETVLDMITLDEGSTYRVLGKTGTRAGDLALAWYVGYIERDENVYVYVINVADAPQVRTRLLREVLLNMGILPPTSEAFR